MESFISKIANCRIRWMDLPGRGTPLFFVHGLGCASSYDYPRVVNDKNFNRRRAILIDLPGYGYSEKPHNFDYNVQNQAAIIDELATHLKIERFFLYGHSMGGSISMEATRLLSDRLAGLIVSEPNFHPGGGYFSRKIHNYSEEEYLTRFHDLLIRNEQGPWSGSLSVAAPWAIWKSAASLVQGSDWFSLFSELEKPKLFIVGEHSLPDNDFDAFNNIGISTSVLPNCGHSMAWENPSALADTLNSFCERNE